MKSDFTLAIIGNPNCGKTALFNLLSGMRQKTGNFAGVTVEQKSAQIALGSLRVQLVDLPGTYSLYPITEDEHIVTRVLLDKTAPSHPDAILYVADPFNLERHLLLYTQVRDLGIPVLLGLSMADLVEKKKQTLDIDTLSRRMGTEIVSFSARTGKGMAQLKTALEGLLTQSPLADVKYELSEQEKALVSVLSDDQWNEYARLIIAHHNEDLKMLSDTEADLLQEKKSELGFLGLNAQVDETLQRFEFIKKNLEDIGANGTSRGLRTNSLKADRFLAHKFLGPIIFFFVLFLIFQAIYSLAELPMTWIEDLFSYSSEGIGRLMPESMFRNLITEGIIPGLAGVLVFIPQIAILFFLLGLLEESGYLSRAIFLFDKFFQRLGLNGRSLIAFVSASACAIPAIMSTRSIKSKKERLVTIFTAPFISCSARTPVYIVLVGFIITNKKVWGFISLQGLTFMGFYLLGILAVIFISLVMKIFMKTEETSFLLIELPEYKWPNLRDILLHTWIKVRSFVTEAGKIIFFISIILWFLASFGPSNRHEMVERELSGLTQSGQIQEEATANLRNALMLEHSYAGHLGRWIEPAIAPLGFDWKIGIALITSFAAREVFVSTMATIYSVGSEDDRSGIRAKMSAEVNPVSGGKRYTRATALSLVIFYIFAMQCMSTLAVVRKETGTWRWPIIQFVTMTGIAYGAAWIVYNWLA